MSHKKLGNLLLNLEFNEIFIYINTYVESELAFLGIQYVHSYIIKLCGIQGSLLLSKEYLYTFVYNSSGSHVSSHWSSYTRIIIHPRCIIKNVYV